MNAGDRPTPVPVALELRELFEGLLGRTVEWKATSHAVDPLDGASVGVYTNDFGVVQALVMADIPLTARAGSAIALLAPAGADKAIKDKLISSAQFDNLAEIFNVAVTLFNKPGTPHLKLDTVFAPRETLPPDAKQLALSLGGRIDGVLDIQGYGPGRISVVVSFF